VHIAGSGFVQIFRDVVERKGESAGGIEAVSVEGVQIEKYEVDRGNCVLYGKRHENNEKCR
jgi:hypothetical protein